MTRAKVPGHRLALVALGGFLASLLCYPSTGPQQRTGSSARSEPHRTNGKIVRGPEILVSRDEDFAHVETMLVADPTDPEHLLAACIILPKDDEGKFLFRTRAYVSRDAGRTWKASPVAGENLWDPVVAFTPRGTALFLSLSKKLLVFRSEDGGATWKDCTELARTGHPMIAVDWTGGEHSGRVYVPGRMGGTADAPFVVHRSADDGRTFETTVVIKEPHVSFALNPVVLRDGTLFVPFSTRIDKDLEQIDCVRSSDGGQSFSQPFRIARRRLDTISGRYGDLSDAVFAGGPHAGKERLYAVYPVHRAEANPRLVLSRSDDSGRTWSEARDIAPGLADELTHGAANVSVNPSGVVGISWLQRKIGPVQQDYKEGEQVAWNFNETYDLFFTASLDGGNTFLAPARITSRSSKPLPKHASRFWPGTDYMLSGVASDGTFHLLWPDARSGIFQLYTCALRVE